MLSYFIPKCYIKLTSWIDLIEFGKYPSGKECWASNRKVADSNPSQLGEKSIDAPWSKALNPNWSCKLLWLRAFAKWLKQKNVIRIDSKPHL